MFLILPNSFQSLIMCLTNKLALTDFGTAFSVKDSLRTKSTIQIKETSGSPGLC